MTNHFAEPALSKDLIAKARHLERERFPREAMRVLEPMIRLAMDGALSSMDAISVHEIASDCAFLRSEYLAALPHIDAWERLALEEGDEARLALAGVQRARILYQQGNYSLARKRVSAAAARALEVSDFCIAARARLFESFIAYAQNDHAVARTLVNEAIEFADTSGDPYVLAFALYGASQHCLVIAREASANCAVLPDAAIVAANEGLVLLKRAEAPAQLCGAESLARMIEFMRLRNWLVLGRAAECVAPLKVLLRDCQLRGHNDVELSVRATLAGALRQIGNPQEALRQAAAGLSAARSHGCVNLAVQNLQMERDLATEALSKNIPHTEPAYLALADTYIEAHATGTLSLAEMAAYCDVGVRTLQVAFRRYRGVSPIAAARNLRLDLAADALLSGNSAVSHIAAQFAFKSSTTFTSEFKRRFGIAPREYQKRNAKAGQPCLPLYSRRIP
ncbi:MAG: helix-turn-helix transcriptional regulator [Betaproteobacteria bacterium]|nr:helix-turn-helix transcriptional regulator [Betaproteobacteria bacterium]